VTISLVLTKVLENAAWQENLCLGFVCVAYLLLKIFAEEWVLWMLPLEILFWKSLAVLKEKHYVSLCIGALFVLLPTAWASFKGPLYRKKSETAGRMLCILRADECYERFDADRIGDDVYRTLCVNVVEAKYFLGDTSSLNETECKILGLVNALEKLESTNPQKWKRLVANWTMSADSDPLGDYIAHRFRDTARWTSVILAVLYVVCCVVLAEASRLLAELQYQSSWHDDNERYTLTLAQVVLLTPCRAPWAIYHMQVSVLSDMCTPLYLFVALAFCHQMLRTMYCALTGHVNQMKHRVVTTSKPPKAPCKAQQDDLQIKSRSFFRALLCFCFFIATAYLLVRYGPPVEQEMPFSKLIEGRQNGTVVGRKTLFEWMDGNKDNILTQQEYRKFVFEANPSMNHTTYELQYLPKFMYQDLNRDSKLQRIWMPVFVQEAFAMRGVTVKTVDEKTGPGPSTESVGDVVAAAKTTEPLKTCDPGLNTMAAKRQPIWRQRQQKKAFKECKKAAKKKDKKAAEEAKKKQAEKAEAAQKVEKAAAEEATKKAAMQNKSVDREAPKTLPAPAKGATKSSALVKSTETAVLNTGHAAMTGVLVGGLVLL